MNAYVRYCAFVLIALSCANGNAFAKKGPKIENRLYSDSTIFSMQIVKGSKPAVGKTFKVNIHVHVHPGWHVWSSAQSPDDDIIPRLLIKIPDSLTDFFAIENLKEFSEIVDRYDSNFLIETKAVYKPFDLVASVRVKRGTPQSTPFYLLVRYMAVNSTVCMPPRDVPIPMTFLGQKPLNLKISGGTKSGKNHLQKVKPAT